MRRVLLWGLLLGMFIGGGCEDKLESPKAATVKGSVIDSLLSAPVESVKVATKPSMDYTYTDSTGFFQLVLPPRSYRLILTKEAQYETLLVSVDTTVIDTLENNQLVDSLTFRYWEIGTLYPDDTTDEFELQSEQVLDLGTLVIPVVIETTEFITTRIDTLGG